MSHFLGNWLPLLYFSTSLWISPSSSLIRPISGPLRRNHGSKAVGPIPSIYYFIWFWMGTFCMPGPGLGTWDRMVSVTIMVLLPWSVQHDSGNGPMGASHPKWGKCCGRASVERQGGTKGGCAGNPDSAVKADFLKEAAFKLRLEFHQGKREGNNVLNKEAAWGNPKWRRGERAGCFLGIRMARRNGDMTSGLNNIEPHYKVWVKYGGNVTCYKQGNDTIRVSF